MYFPNLILLLIIIRLFTQASSNPQQAGCSAFNLTNIECLPERIVQMLCQSSTKTASGEQSQEYDEQLMLYARLRRLKSWSRLQAESPELQVIRRCLTKRKWDSAPKQYLHVHNELTYIGQVIFRGTRIVVSQAEKESS